MKKGNIVGEPFAKYVNEQIKQRQNFHGSGFNDTRDPKHLVYLNSKTSWVKMASSVSVNDSDSNDGKKRLTNMGLNPVNDFIGQGLARKSVLFNGLSEAKFNKIDKPESEDKTEQFGGFSKREGYTKTNSIWNNNSAYGLGGTEFGIQPMPGINNVEISHLNRGSIRKATVVLKAYNKFQFELIETLYLRLGYTMLLEWGNNYYIENDTSNLEQVGNTLVEDFWFIDNSPQSKTHLDILEKIERYREKYDGNYDGFFGRVSNFNWEFNSDGSYSITIDLISLGDVIESLKINTLFSPTQTPLPDDKFNLSTIQNHLKTVRENFNNYQNNPSYFSPSHNKATKTSISTWAYWFSTGSSGKSPNFYYMKFGELLNHLQDYIIYNLLNSEEQPFPIISIDTDEDSNIMPLYKNQFSIDPRVCIINSNYFSLEGYLYAGKILEFKYPEFFNDLKPFYDPKDNIPHGKIMNIYLNFELIEKTLENNTDKKGNLDLFKFLQSLCDSINKSLGSVNQLEPIVDEDRNTIVIIDQSPVPQNLRNKLRKNINPDEEEKSIPFNLYGYNPNDSTSNFVKSFSFKTEISPDLSTIISIGATAQGMVVGEDATAFSKWNSGLTDRFQKKIKQFSQKEELEKKGIRTNNNKVTAIDTFTINNGLGPYKYGNTPTNAKYYIKWIQNGQLYGKERTTFGNLSNQTIKNKITEDVRKLQEEYKKAVTPSFKQDQKIAKKKIDEKIKNNFLPTFPGYLFKSWGNKAFPTYSYQIESKYFKGDKDFINKGLKMFTSDFFSNPKRKKQTSSIGFIPVKLQIEIEGMSGIKIYQSLKVNTKFLPGNYPEVLEFLVTKVNHTLQNNQWVTKIETISQPVIKGEETSNLIKEPTPTITISPPGIVFNLPVDPTVPGTLNIRNDSGGAGYYGAKRGTRIHKGLDLSTFPFQQIFSPIDGIAKFTKAKPLSKLTGIKIIGTGIYKGYTAYMHYTQSIVGLINTTVKAGDLIGTPSDLSPDYPENVTDHIHFSVKKDDTYVNPAYLMYNINGEIKQGVDIFQGL